MAFRKPYLVVAIIGILGVSTAAWWMQNHASSMSDANPSSGSSSVSTAGGSNARGGAAGQRPASVEVVTVESAQVQDDVQSVGSLKSKQNVMLRPEVAGKVIALGFAEGDRVRAGQVLVQLDDTLQRAEVKQAQAQMSIATANFKRNQELVSQNFISQRVLDESDASLQVAKAQLDLTCARWARTAVVAPFDGILGLRNVNLGDYVKDGADLIALEDTSSMLLDFKLPEKMAPKVKPGLKVQVFLDAIPQRQFSATVIAVDPAIDVNGRSIAIRAELPNSMGEAIVNKEPSARAAVSGGAASASSGQKVVTSVQQNGSSVTIVSPYKANASATSKGQSTPSMPLNKTKVVMQKDVAQAIGCGASVKPISFVAKASANAKGPMPLKPGMFARVLTIFAVKENTIMVPEEAIVPQGGKQFVIRVVKPSEVPADIMAAAKAAAASAAAAQKGGAAPSQQGQSSGSSGKASPDGSGQASEAPALVSLRQEVKLGIRKAGKVEILEGLQPGQTIVLAGQQRLQRDVTPVRVVGSGRPEARSNNTSNGNPMAAAQSSQPGSATSR